MDRLKVPLLLVSLVMVWGTIGSVVWQVIDQSPLFEHLELLQETNSPLVAPTTTPDVLQIKSEIEELIQQLPGTWGVYFEDLETSQNFGINETRKFYAASLSKVPILIAYFEQIEKGELSPRDKVTYMDTDFESGDGSIRQSPLGTEFTLNQVVTKLIKESDNVAKNILIRKVGYQNIKSVIERVGANDTYLPDNVTTTADMVKFFQAIYTNQLTSKSSSSQMIGLLTDTYFEDRLPQPLPENVQVAHKIGTWP
ncbi:class A beta-lactamase-related serine hydrolase, partial [Candidatus Parcubacteria bacterium]|nr:class A beta-lactamase-related serine hydrolase [Candidatus Parcubacteria bacterium]